MGKQTKGTFVASLTLGGGDRKEEFRTVEVWVNPDGYMQYMVAGYEVSPYMLNINSLQRLVLQSLVAGFLQH